MTYIFTAVYVTLYAYIVRVRGGLVSFFIAYSPILLLLLLILGFQHNVGTDYYSYLALASGEKSFGWIERKGEHLFITVNNFVIFLGEPQLIFFFLGFIQIIFLMLFIYQLKNHRLSFYWFIFLYFTFLLVFFNSFNGIRQYTAVYIVVLSILYLFAGYKLRFLFLWVAGSLFHSSAIFFAVFYFTRRYLFIEWGIKKVLVLSAFTFVFSIFSWHFGYKEIHAYLITFTKYAHYVDSDYFQSKTSLINIATKLPKILTVLLCGYIIQVYYPRLYKKFTPLINLSYISIIVLILSLSNSVVWRMYQYFDIFTVFPLLILLSFGYQKSITRSIVCVLTVIWILKVTIFAVGEYRYSSIFGI